MFRIFGAALLLSACASVAAPVAPQDAFFADLSRLCGKAYEGKLVSSEAVDADMATAPLVMEARSCTDSEIRIPFHVGEDRSRTWVISRTPGGLRLKHDHRHEDGSEDVLTQYGGDTLTQGTATRQDFPADDFSKDLFVREGRAVSVDNVWAVEINAENFAYELRRPNRHFRVEFDLTRPAPNPPAPWGGV